MVFAAAELALPIKRAQKVALWRQFFWVDVSVLPLMDVLTVQISVYEFGHVFARASNLLAVGKFDRNGFIFKFDVARGVLGIDRVVNARKLDFAKVFVGDRRGDAVDDAAKARKIIEKLAGIRVCRQASHKQRGAGGDIFIIAAAGTRRRATAVVTAWRRRTASVTTVARWRPAAAAIA